MGGDFSNPHTTYSDNTTIQTCTAEAIGYAAVAMGRNGEKCVETLAQFRHEHGP